MYVDSLGGGNAAAFCVIGFGFVVPGLVTVCDDVFDAGAPFAGIIFILLGGLGGVIELPVLFGGCLGCPLLD